LQGLINNNLDHGEALIVEEQGKVSQKALMSATKKQLIVDLSGKNPCCNEMQLKNDRLSLIERQQYMKDINRALLASAI
jgi:hypothetical protein